MTGLPPGFKLNLTSIHKNANAPRYEKEVDEADPPKLPQPKLLNQDIKRGATLQNNPRPAVTGAVRQSATLARKNLVIQSSDSDSDFDIDLVSVPVGKENPEEMLEQPPDVVEAPMVQVSQLPELDVDDDDDFQGQGKGHKLSILHDLLLPQDLADEPPEEWSYRTFIKQFANSEASQENADDDDDEYDDEYEPSEDDDDDDTEEEYDDE